MAETNDLFALFIRFCTSGDRSDRAVACSSVKPGTHPYARPAARDAHFRMGLAPAPGPTRLVGGFAPQAAAEGKGGAAYVSPVAAVQSSTAPPKRATLADSKSSSETAWARRRFDQLKLMSETARGVVPLPVLGASRGMYSDGSVAGTLSSCALTAFSDAAASAVVKTCVVAGDTAKLARLRSRMFRHSCDQDNHWELSFLSVFATFSSPSCSWICLLDCMRQKRQKSRSRPETTRRSTTGNNSHSHLGAVSTPACGSLSCN